MTFTVTWMNSWRDDYNYDAAYIFFKFRRKPATNATSDSEVWHHLYLQEEGTQVAPEMREDYDCWLSPLSENNKEYYTGVYLFRKETGAGNNSVDVTVNWNIKRQLGVSLQGYEFVQNNILISAFAVEMVYVPRGAYRIGDGISEKSFRKAINPILPAYDVVSDTFPITASSGAESHPERAANRTNDNTANTENAWVGGANNAWWIIDFGIGKEKKITYFGVNGAKYLPDNYPGTFRLFGGTSTDGPWDELWSGPGRGNWCMSASAYPVENAIRIPKEKVANYRCYKLQIDNMERGVPTVTAIGMTDVELDTVWDHTVLIDRPDTPLDTLRYLGARDGSTWTGTLPATFPNGYRGFYAMKYEISQEQYIRFLNKLSYDQQNALLGGKLDALEEGDYIFGEDIKNPDHRNGIIISSKRAGYPVVFSNNLDQRDDAGRDGDGQNIACNYMCIYDMLAYADWACLRPLTEMEYEKMSRPLYPYLPEKGEYAWNNLHITKAQNLNASGLPEERALLGNANFDNLEGIGGPLRVGSFATANWDRENAGAGFWGLLELSGNLSEMYYNVNNRGLTLVTSETSSGNTPGNFNVSHGDGYLTADGHSNNANWKVGPEYIALRGGSFASPARELAVSDRSYHLNALAAVTERKATVSFRLGRSVPEQLPILSYLTLENEASTREGKFAEDIASENRTQPYRIQGNNAPSGSVFSYIWYMKEYNDTYWRVLEGETHKDLVYDHFRTDTVNNQVYYFKRKIITPFADSETSSEYDARLTVNWNIVNFGSYRAWSNGTYARSAAEYRNPAAGHRYSGDIGDGIYRIDPDGPEGPVEPFDVYCDMTTEGGGWTLVLRGASNTATFAYDKDIWVNTTPLGTVSTALTANADFKSPAYASVAFKEIRLSVNTPDNYLKWEVTGKSLYALMMNPGGTLFPPCSVADFKRVHKAAGVDLSSKNLDRVGNLGDGANITTYNSYADRWRLGSFWNLVDSPGDIDYAIGLGTRGNSHTEINSGLVGNGRITWVWVR